MKRLAAVFAVLLSSASLVHAGPSSDKGCYLWLYANGWMCVDGEDDYFYARSGKDLKWTDPLDVELDENSTCADVADAGAALGSLAHRLSELSTARQRVLWAIEERERDLEQSEETLNRLLSPSLDPLRRAAESARYRLMIAREISETKKTAEGLDEKIARVKAKDARLREAIEARQAGCPPR